MQVYSQKSISTTLPRTRLRVSGGELIQTAALISGAGACSSLICAAVRVEIEAARMTTNKPAVNLSIAGAIMRLPCLPGRRPNAPEFAPERRSVDKPGPAVARRTGLDGGVARTYIPLVTQRSE